MSYPESHKDILHSIFSFVPNDSTELKNHTNYMQTNPDMQKHPSSLTVLAELSCGIGRNQGSHCFARMSVEAEEI
jgi:hypothetical protein